MTPAQYGAMAIGCKLFEANQLAKTRAGMAATAINRGAPLARWLMTSARLDDARRQLRGQLREALAEVGRSPGRHASGYWLPPAAEVDSRTTYRGGRHRRV